MVSSDPKSAPEPQSGYVYIDWDRSSMPGTARASRISAGRR